MSTPLTLELIKRVRMAPNSTIADLNARLRLATGLDGDAYITAIADVLGLEPLLLPEKLSPRFDLISFAECQERDCMVLTDHGGTLYFMLRDPFDSLLRRWAFHRIARPHRVAVTSEAKLQACLALHERAHRALSQMEVRGEGAETGEAVTEISLTSIAQDASPVVKFVNSTLYDALKAKASDIHFESDAEGMHVKYRIDGVLLRAGDAAGTKIAEQTISRLKVLAELDISEHRVPQDGRFKVAIAGRHVDFRVSIMPSIHGEDAVLRVLDKQGMGDEWKSLRLDILGLDAETVAGIRALAKEPYGLLLVTGPTGSGKSTTLYSALSEINDGTEKIITIEDPVEYQLPGVLQIPVNDKKGLTFARGLRSILRHDPDKILVGEIRDGETAGIAVQAAQTGHLVFASVHANSVFSVLDRFMHMGIETNSFVDALIGVVAQRLIRKNCRYCVEEHAPTPADLAQLEKQFPREDLAQWRFRRGRGCDECRGTGYLGRQAIAEVLRMNDSLKQAFTTGVSPVEVQQRARAQGFANLRTVALRAVSRGQTTLEEVNRVTFAD